MATGSFQLRIEPYMDIQLSFEQAEGFQEKARRIVFEHVFAQFDKSDKVPHYTVNDVYVVWFCKTLKNWKALVSTTIPDQMYYEVTYNGEVGETYLDAYKKIANVRVPDEI
jgi:hypothetical protein